MKTLEMIRDWQASDFKKTYLQTDSDTSLPTTIGGRDGVLRISGFRITVNNPIPYTDNFILTSKNLMNEWGEIVTEYGIKEAIEKAKKGDIMVSLASSNKIYKQNLDLYKFSVEEVTGVWIETFKNF